MTASSQFNAYDRYYEARIYQEGPFRHRPYDVTSLVASYTGYSKYATDDLLSAKVILHGVARLLLLVATHFIFRLGII